MTGRTRFPWCPCRQKRNVCLKLQNYVFLRRWLFLHGSVCLNNIPVWRWGCHKSCSKDAQYRRQWKDIQMAEHLINNPPPPFSRYLLKLNCCHQHAIVHWLRGLSCSMDGSDPARDFRFDETFCQVYSHSPSPYLSHYSKIMHTSNWDWPFAGMLAKL